MAARMAARRILCVDDHADTCALIAALFGDCEKRLPTAVHEIFASRENSAFSLAGSP